MKSARLSTVTRVVLLMAVYFLGGIIGRSSLFLPEQITLVWPPFGIGLAALLLFGLRFWPGVAAGALLFAFSIGSHFYLALASAIGSSIAAVICTHLLRKFGFRNSLERVRDVAALAIFAAILGTAANALFNVAGLSLQTHIAADEFMPRAVEWWVPNILSVLVVTPLFLSWGTKEQAIWSKPKIPEAVFCAFCLVGATMLSFQSWYVYGLQAYPFAYLPYPFLVWGALRFGHRGASTGTLIIAFISISALMRGRGPFVMPEQRDSLVLLGSYIAVLALTNLLLAAAATEKEQAEFDVRTSEKRYRGIVEDQTELIWRFRGDGTVTFVNDAYCRFHRKTRAELLGSKYLPMLSDEDREIPLSYFGSMPPENPTITYDYRIALPDGKVVWQQCTTRRLFDDQGQTLEFQSVAQDVTRRKQVEEQIREAEQRLRVIVESMVDGLIVCDARAVITSFNPAAEKIFGLREARVLGWQMADLLTEESRPAFAAYLENSGQLTRIVESEAQHADGRKVPIDLAVSKVWVGGSALLIGIIRDITERKRLEEQFRQTQKMEAVGRLAGGIAHDFNNLIQAISGYATVLLSRETLDPGSRGMVEQIEKAGERAAALTSQLLAFSRHQVLKPRFFSLNQTVLEMEKLLLRLIGTEIKLVTSTDHGQNVVRADPGQIEQIILNLCVNARDAMPQGGVLRITSESVVLNARLDEFSAEFKPGEYVQLAISDTGTGMSAETKARLFEPFFTTKPVGKGTGLGLSIVYGIMKQSGGEVRIESDIGKGTTFYIYLPRFSDSAIEQDQPSGAPIVKRGRETILLVEDGEIVRALLGEVLSSSGYNVIESCDGEEALTKVADSKQAIDLLITDLAMPKLDGKALAEQLIRKYQRMRVIYMSGYTDDEALRYGKGHAAGTFLQKPFKPDLLLTRVREILDAKS